MVGLALDIAACCELLTLELMSLGRFSNAWLRVEELYIWAGRHVDRYDDYVDIETGNGDNILVNLTAMLSVIRANAKRRAPLRSLSGFLQIKLNLDAIYEPEDPMVRLCGRPCFCGLLTLCLNSRHEHSCATFEG
jgi:hypothetical protein